jgi:4-amino-4-deoxy-L-arabinose transferase-like glycosyltransferase
MMFDLTGELNSYLVSGERVLWQGRAKRRLNVMATSGVAFIIMFVGFALIFGFVFTLTSTSSLRRDPAAIILPIIFLAVGLGVGIPWVLMGNRASNARYFVTNLSAIIVYAPLANSGQRVTMVSLKNLQQLTLSENRDGTGTLTLASSPYAYGRYSSSWASDAVPTFANIEQPWEVYQLIRKQMDEVNFR